MIPSIGRIVHYTINEYNVTEINSHQRSGNSVTQGDVYPMMITRLWTDNPDETSVVQGQVFLDGNDTLWVTSVQQGDGEGQWHKPPMTA